LEALLLKGLDSDAAVGGDAVSEAAIQVDVGIAPLVDPEIRTSMVVRAMSANPAPAA